MWNAQLIQYAGYKNGDGSILGDPASEEFTTVSGLSIKNVWQLCGLVL